MTLPEQAETVVIGGGHNGLTCAAYLARAGREVLVLEARGTAGGCASTVDAIGARVNICNCDHTMVLASGIVTELDLAAHGLRYLDVDPVQIAVSWSDAPGTHLLSLEVLWTPYALRGGWAGSAEPRSWLERLETLCQPGLLDAVAAWRAMTPPDYEGDFGLARGYAPSFPGGVIAALTGRQPELSRYRTPVKGLYLTGAATFPGAGVWGASGRNTAAVVQQGNFFLKGNK